MKPFLVSKLLFLSAFIFGFSFLTKAQRTVSSFNKDWKFILEDHPEFSNETLNDASWTVLNIPHDWAFEKGVRPGGTQNQGGGYHDGGIGWYRKYFNVSGKSFHNITYIDFQGVYMNSEVWINGQRLGKRPYGYISFRYDISKHLKPGKNTLAVRVDNSLEPSARWYHPCGIYAPVHLIEVNPTHIAPHGIYITTPSITNEKASVHAQIKITSDKHIANGTTVSNTIFSPSGEEVASSSSKVFSTSAALSAKLNVLKPVRWSPESPNLYVLRTQIKMGNEVIDEVRTNFGFRSLKWETETGFWLNDKNIKIKGACEHWEGGPVGGAWTKPMLRWKLQLLKDMGLNAIRPAHNPCPPMFYDICDEIGLLVMDEIFDGWHKKAAHDYGEQAFDNWWQRDITEWITRDRNHPSVFIWSLGNETHSDIAPALVKFCNKLDPTRLVTSGSGNTEDMQVAGMNGGSEYTTTLESNPFGKPFISTEAPHTWQTRGYYRTQTWWRDGLLKNTYPLPSLTKKEIFFYEWSDPKNWKNKKQHLNSSYDNATVRISARKNWEVMRDLPWHSGHFRWTGFDYYGESGLAHGGWPFNLFMGGALDVAGFKKDLYYFYQSQWTNAPMVHILPSWTHPHMQEGTVIPVWVYSNTDEVELFLNGKSLGKDKPGTAWNEMQCEWMVPYQTGKLEAVAYQNGKVVKRSSFTTAKQPTKLKNTVQKLDAEDGFNSQYIVTTEGVDAKGNTYPYAENKVYYASNGGVKKVSLENGNPVDSTSRAKASHRALFMGKTRAYFMAQENAKQASVVTAAILGDKSLYLSNKISIDVEQIPLLGKAKKSTFVVLYTKNGGDPAKIGAAYTQPFEVKDGSTVNAVVKQNGKIILTMSESFGTSEGLFWGNEHSEDMWIGRGINIPAESAILGGTAKTSTHARRYKSDGFVVFKKGEGSITWYQENDGQPGDYTLRIRYMHNDKGKLHPMTLMVNDKVITTFDFKPTGGWEKEWKFVSAKVKFKAGANNIELKTTGQSGPYIDELFVE